MSNLRAILTRPMPKRDTNRNRSALVLRFRATVRRRGDKYGELAKSFGVSRQHLYYVLAGKRGSELLMDKLTRYIEEGSK